jgi:rRNA maturation protein Nop10
MSLKEKFQVVLNQKGQFKCPNSGGSVKLLPQSGLKIKQPVPSRSKDDRFAKVVANLKQRGTSRPRTLKKLKSTIASLFPKGISEADLATLIQQLQSRGEISIAENKVSYAH